MIFGLTRLWSVRQVTTHLSGEGEAAEAGDVEHVGWK
jgi:hypothetical protein